MVGNNVVKVFVYLVPVYNIPPVGHILGPPVLVPVFCCVR